MANKPALGNGDIERKRAEEDLERRNRELAALNDVAAALSQSLNEEEILNWALDKVLEVMGAEAGAINLIDDATKKLTTAVQRGLPQSVLTARRARVGEWVMGRVAQDGQVEVVSDTSQYKGKVRKEALEAGYRSTAIAPLKAHDRVLGTMAVLSSEQGRFTSEDGQLLASIGSQVAVALENARLYAQAERRAVTDDLTGLYNHRHFHERLEQEAARASRHGQTFALVITDIDHFKEYNDAHGHLAGDRILKEVAQAVQGSIRQYDLAFRYGGDEFALILPGASEDEAGAIVQRIRERVERLMSEEEALLTPALGLSAGVACYPADAIERRELIVMADRALYQAKRQGANGTCLASDLGR